MATPKTYRPWSPEQPHLLPPCPRDWLPDGHLARFILELVQVLDISGIEDPIQDKDHRGERPYHPRMMLALLVYAYSTGVFASRRIERRTYEDIAFRYLAGDQHPDFRTIAAFRRNHLAAIELLFGQVVRMSQHAGLVKLGHVSLDGSKVHANASKHKAMSYDRMTTDAARLQAEIVALLTRAERVNADDDARLGEGVPEVDVPAELARREDRFARILRAKAALEEDARATRAEQLRAQADRARDAAEQAETAEERERAMARADRREAAATAVESVPGAVANDARDDVEDEVLSPAVDDELPTHRPKVTRHGLPKPAAQRNFTDPDSRIMERGGDIVQAYNCQAAVDAEFQIIVAQGVSNQSPDTHYFVPMFRRVLAVMGACPRWPRRMRGTGHLSTLPGATPTVSTGTSPPSASATPLLIQRTSRSLRSRRRRRCAARSPPPRARRSTPDESASPSLSSARSSRRWGSGGSPSAV